MNCDAVVKSIRFTFYGEVAPDARTPSRSTSSLRSVPRGMGAAEGGWLRRSTGMRWRRLPNCSAECRQIWRAPLSRGIS